MNEEYEIRVNKHGPIKKMDLKSKDNKIGDKDRIMIKFAQTISQPEVHHQVWSRIRSQILQSSTHGDVYFAYTIS